MKKVLYQFTLSIGAIYESLIEILAEQIFLYTDTPIFNNRLTQLIFNKYAELIMSIGAILTILIFGINKILYAIGFFMPAILANFFPPLGKKIVMKYGNLNFWVLKILKSLYEEPINIKKLGSHKTWGGIVFGVLFGVIGQLIFNSVLTIIIYLFKIKEIVVFDNLVLAFAFAVAALSGDAIGSWIKRKQAIPPGVFVPMDLYDWSWAALAVAILSYEFWQAPLLLSLCALTLLPVGSSISGIIAVLLKIKDSR
jgi:hypothetical protein